MRERKRDKGLACRGARAFRGRANARREQHLQFQEAIMPRRGGEPELARPAAMLLTLPLLLCSIGAAGASHKEPPCSR